jgi:hypothetical protein
MGKINTKSFSGIEQLSTPKPAPAPAAQKTVAASNVSRSIKNIAGGLPKSKK